MFWEDIEPHMTPGLQDAVSRGYDVFAKYQLSGPLIYCHCPVCMTAEVAADLSKRPLRELSANLLAEYTNSAHGDEGDEVEAQFKYFLPRYLDLIAHCDPPSHLGLETCLTRLEGYRSRWPQPEIDAIDALFDAFVAASVDQVELLEWPAGLSLAYDMGEVLTMIVLSGGDLDRALAIIDHAPDPEAAIHMASMRANVQQRRGLPYFQNAHLDQYPEAAHTLGGWLYRDFVTERIIATHEMLNDPNYDDVFNAGA